MGRPEKYHPFDGEKPPAESADKSAHSKTFPYGSAALCPSVAEFGLLRCFGKAMHHFFLPTLPPDAASLALQGAEATHASQAVRVRVGEEVTVLDGKGTRVLAKVSGISRRQVELEVLRAETEPRPNVEITLFQAITKPKSMEVIIQKATELGVHRIQPVISERVVSRADQDGGVRKSEKWQRIAIEALKQSGGAWLPQVEAPTELRQLLASGKQPALSFIASLQPGARLLHDWLEATSTQTTDQESLRVSIWIGPEGDFTPTEVEALLAAGAKPITLGRTVLRSETAALCALAILSYALACSPPKAC